MVPPSPVSSHVPLLTVSQNSIEALERLRASYQGQLAPESLTSADQAVLTAVEINLKQARYKQPA